MTQFRKSRVLLPDIEILAKSYEISGLTRIWYLDDKAHSEIRIKAVESDD